MPLPTEPIDDRAPAPETSTPTTLALVREVQGPGSERSRVAGLAMVCSAAGVALGFALAGSLFAAMAPQPRGVMGSAAWSHCPSAQGGHGHGMRGDFGRADVGSMPWLGIRVRVAADAHHHSTPPVLETVFADTPAADAGLRSGDRVTRFDGEPVESAAELIQLIRAHQPGDLVDLEAHSRDGRELSISRLRLAAMPTGAR